MPNAWHWDFGDGNTSSMQNPVHQYVSNGTYTVGSNEYEASNYAALVDLKIDYPFSVFIIPYGEVGYMMNSWDKGELKKENDENSSANSTADFDFGGAYVVAGLKLAF